MNTVDPAAVSVLIVDDDAYMHELLALTLRRLGFARIRSALGGAAALELLDAEPQAAQLLFCDLKMPQMDGLEFLRHLAEREHPGAIVLFSGEDSRILRAAVNLARAHFLNVLGSVEKPVTPEALRRLLEQLSPDSLPPPDQPKHRPPTVGEFRQALGSEALRLYYQPQVELHTGTLVGVEALARWKHPQQGLLGPASFVPLAEHSSLVREFTEHTLEQAFRQAAAWQAADLPLRLAVNLSMAALNRLDFPEYLLGLVQAHGLEPENLMLEITESRLMQDLATSLEILVRLRLNRLGLSIDDFGTGYSTLEQLKRIPFIELKIDRSFVHGAAHDPAARAILESSISLAKQLKLTIVAEGVENREDWELVRELDCDQAQGYYIARPMPAEALPAWIAAWNGRGLAEKRD